MPAILTETDEFTVNVEIPVNTDLLDASEDGAFRKGIQALANRTKNLFNRLAAGVKRIQFYSDLTSLKAVTGQATGDVAIALDGLGRMGLYRYDTAYSGAEISPYYLKPNGFSDGTDGRWVHLFFNYGITDSDDSLNRWTFNGPGRVVEVAESSTTTGTVLNNSGATWLDTGLSITKTLKLGDVVEVRGTGDWSVDEIVALFGFRLQVTAPSGAAALDGSTSRLHAMAANKNHLFHVEGKWTAAEAGSHTFKVQALVPDDVNPTEMSLGARAIRALWIRP